MRELARRIGKSADNTTYYLIRMRKDGIIVKEHGHTYRLGPPSAPPPGATHLDFGDWLMRL